MSDTSTTSTGMTGAGGGNMLRITGLSTGLDVDAMVKKMLTAEQTKLDKAKQTQQTIQWKQDAYQDIIKDIKDLQSSFFDTSSSDKNILSSKNFSPFTVSGTDSSTVDTSVATFAPGVGAQTGQYSIKVDKLAKGAGFSNKVANTTISTTLSNMGITDSTINLTLKVGNSDSFNVTLDNSKQDATIQDLINAINNTGAGSVKASFNELTSTFKLNTATTGDSTTIAIGGSNSTNLSSLFGFSTNNDAIKISKDGATNGIVSGGNLTIQNAQNADVTITEPDGSQARVTNQSTNNFSIDGMNYTLSSENATATVKVGSDTQKVYDKIKDFIDKYNTVVDKIQGELTETKNKDYSPLTDAQKAAMSSSQITAWETKAKQGILRNDENLQTMLNDLQSAFTTSVANTGLLFGKYGSNAIGIDMSDDYKKPGHVEIADPSKLQDAITKQPDLISKMFINISTKTDGSANYNGNTQEYQEDGILNRVKTILEKNVGYTNVTLNTAILTSYANTQYDYSMTGTGGKNTIPDQLYEQQLMIKKITSDMSDQQEKYYKQFSDLETAMTTLNAQQSQLSSMLGG